MAVFHLFLCLQSIPLYICTMSNYTSYHLLLEWLLSPQVITSVGHVVQKKDPSLTAGGNVDWHRYYGKHYGGSSKLKNRVTIWPSNPSSGYLPKKLKTFYSQNYMHPCVHCSIIQSGQSMKTTKGLLLKITIKHYTLQLEKGNHKLFIPPCHTVLKVLYKKQRIFSQFFAFFKPEVFKFLSWRLRVMKSLDFQGTCTPVIFKQTEGK